MEVARFKKFIKFIKKLGAFTIAVILFSLSGMLLHRLADVEEPKPIVINLKDFHGKFYKPKQIKAGTFKITGEKTIHDYWGPDAKATYDFSYQTLQIEIWGQDSDSPYAVQYATEFFRDENIFWKIYKLERTGATFTLHLKKNVSDYYVIAFTMIAAGIALFVWRIYMIVRKK